MDILSVVTRVPILVFGVERYDDDFADRINYKYTVAVLVIFAIIVTNRQFGTKQIHCWIPAYFTRNYEEYINDICWVSNTYYISLDQKLPEADQIRKSFELKYYQWVPFILLLQAFFFYIPHIAWRALSRRSGIDVRDIVEAAGNYKSVDKYEIRKKYMSYMLTAVDQYCDDPRRRKESRGGVILRRMLSAVCCISGKFLGNYLMVLYLFIKLTFIANCISQMFVLNLLLGHEFHKFGFELIDKIINGKGWDTGSRIFPKISMCDFRIREVGNPKVSHRYTVQCVLPINLFNQQIFTFIWFWYAIVLLINLYSLCVWTYRFLPAKRLRYIKRRIDIMRQALFWRNKNPLNFEQMPESLQMHEFEVEIIQHFVHEYLESDGLFILRVLSSNTSDFVCTELIQELWKYYRKQRKFNRTSEDDDDVYDEESMENSDGDNRAPKLMVQNKREEIVNNDEDEDSEDDDDNENEDDEEDEEGGETEKQDSSDKSVVQNKRTPTLSSSYKAKLSFVNKTRNDQNNINNKSNDKTVNNESTMPNYDVALKKNPPNRLPISKKSSNSFKRSTLTKPFLAFSGQIVNFYNRNSYRIKKPTTTTKSPTNDNSPSTENPSPNYQNQQRISIKMARLNRSCSLNQTTMPSNRDLFKIKKQHLLSPPSNEDQSSYQLSSDLRKVTRTQSQKTTSTYQTNMTTVRTYNSRYGGSGSGGGGGGGFVGNEVVSNLTTPELASPKEIDEYEEEYAQNQSKFLEK